jgi:hypothetical protein
VSKGAAEPRLPVIKALFAMSNNVCAFRDPDRNQSCEVVLTNPSWKQVKARMCHIRGEAPGSARFDESMTDEERRSYENIILMCPNHHSVIDECEPERFTVAILEEMKRVAEQRSEPFEQWTTESQLDRFAILLEVMTSHLARVGPVPPVNPPAGATGHIEFTASARGTVEPQEVKSGGSGIGGGFSEPNSGGESGVLGSVGDRERMLLTQINQIVGYNAVAEFQAETGDTYAIRLTKPLSEEELAMLNAVSTEQQIAMRFHFKDEIWEARPTGLA